MMGTEDPPPGGRVARSEIPVEGWRGRLAPALAELKKGR